MKTGARWWCEADRFGGGQRLLTIVRLGRRWCVLRDAMGRERRCRLSAVRFCTPLEGRQ